MDPGVQALGENIKDLTLLKRAMFNFGWCIKMSDQGIAHFAENLKSLSSLKAFDLSLRNCERISDKSLESLSNSLESLESLENIQISFVYCRSLTDKGLSLLAKSLEKISSVKNLRLDFRWNPINDLGIKDLGQSLKKLDKLEKIDFDFSECVHITDEGLMCLSDSLGMLSSSLKTLKLNLSCFPGITDKGMKKFGSSLKQLALLKKVSLKFQDCPKIMNKGANDLVEGLRGHSKLRNIVISLARCKVKEEAFVNLCEMLTEVISLEHVMINFRECPDIREEVIDTQRENLFKLPLLKKLDLYA